MTSKNSQWHFIIDILSEPRIIDLYLSIRKQTVKIQEIDYTITSLSEFLQNKLTQLSFNLCPHYTIGIWKRGVYFYFSPSFPNTNLTWLVIIVFLYSSNIHVLWMENIWRITEWNLHFQIPLTGIVWTGPSNQIKWFLF